MRNHPDIDDLIEQAPSLMDVLGDGVLDQQRLVNARSLMAKYGLATRIPDRGDAGLAVKNVSN